MANAPFQWVGNQAVTSPEAAKRQRDVAAALLANNASPKNWTEGLSSVLAGLSANKIGSDVNAAEQEGRASAAASLAGIGPNAGFEDISAALANPWISQPQASVASALLQQNLERQDPMYQLQMQKAQAELDALQNPQGQTAEYFGATLPYQDANGNLQYVQLNKGGLPQLPSGSRWLEPTSTVNTGTAQTVVGRNTGQVQGAIPIDNMGAAQDTAVGSGLGGQSLSTIDAGRNAQGNNAKLAVLEQTLANAPQGAAGGITQLAGTIGLDIGGLSDIQASQAIINQLVPLQRAPGSGTMSDADLALYKASLPAILNQPGANKQIISTARALNDYTIQHANIEQQLINGEIDLQTAQALKQQIPNPLATMSGGASPAAAPANGITIRRLD